MYFHTLIDTEYDCSDCVDGQRPAGVRGILGPVLRECLDCGDRCPNCRNRSVHLPWAEDAILGPCDGCIADQAKTLGMILNQCPECYGITGLIPLDPADTYPPISHRGCDLDPYKAVGS